MLDKEDFIKARDRLKQSLIKYIVCFVVMILSVKCFSLIPQEGLLFTTIVAIAVIAALGHLYYFFVIIFRIRFVLQRMNEGAGLWQLGVIFIPYIGVIVLPMLVLQKANTFLAAQT